MEPRAAKGRKVKTHVNLDPVVWDLLEAIARRMGSDPLYPTPSRSDLLNKAARLYITECRQRPELKEVIEAVEARISAGASVIRYPGSSSKAGARKLAARVEKRRTS